MNVSLSPVAPENLVSRDGLGSPVPRQPAHLHTQAESGAYLRDRSSVRPRLRTFDLAEQDKGFHVCSLLPLPPPSLLKIQ